MRIELPPSPKILVVVLQRLGDVLLTTPLIRSIRRAWPDATIDALVFSDTVGILAGIPDLNSVVTMPTRPTAIQSLVLAARLWNRYALAISVQAGDRPTFFTVLAGRRRAAPVESRLSGRIKRRLLHRTISAEGHMHRVERMLQLADAIGIARVGEVVCPQSTAAVERPAGPYAVVHAAPMFRYKQWTVDGWRALAAALAHRGLQVVTTGGPAAAERQYLDTIWGEGSGVLRREGAYDWPQLAKLIAGARVYVGPDTSVTHLAAATGCPTVALFGPTDPGIWGPWPMKGLAQPWGAAGTIQRRDNVWLVQHSLPCMPCQLEGCERRIGSYSRCLDEMPHDTVLEAVDLALGQPSPGRGGAAALSPV